MSLLKDKARMEVILSDFGSLSALEVKHGSW